MGRRVGFARARLPTPTTTTTATTAAAATTTRRQRRDNASAREPRAAGSVRPASSSSDLGEVVDRDRLRERRHEPHPYDHPYELGIAGRFAVAAAAARDAGIDRSFAVTGDVVLLRRLWAAPRRATAQGRRLLGGRRAGTSRQPSRRPSLAGSLAAWRRRRRASAAQSRRAACSAARRDALGRGAISDRVERGHPSARTDRHCSARACRGRSS